MGSDPNSGRSSSGASQYPYEIRLRPLFPLPRQRQKIMPLKFASRLDNVETSAIRELFKLLGKPGIISFAGGFPDSAMFDVEGLKEASNKALTEEPGGALQYGATEGY